jgi:putative phosphoribosyl transferase
MANSSGEFRRRVLQPFRNRRQAGRLLAPLLHHLAGMSEVVVLALPRGGVPVAYEVAAAIRAPLDVFIVRKLGVPGCEELAMGAIASGGARVFDNVVVSRLRIQQREIAAIAERELRELERREQLYRGRRPYPELDGKIVVIVDDGVATGLSMLVAVSALRQRRPAKIVVAVPVAPVDSLRLLSEHVDEVFCCATPARFGGVGTFYDDFSQVTDEEVRTLLKQAALREAP